MNLPLSLKILFLTGQSNPDSCELSPTQTKVAHRLKNYLLNAEVEVATLNFPYDPDLRPYQPTNLLFASLSNTQQFFCSRIQRFAQRYHYQVIKQFQGASQYLILAGSCGLEIYNNLGLPKSLLSHIHIIAYGPVARNLPETNIMLIQGRRDSLSKYFVKNAHYRVDCGHMDYLECEEVIQLMLNKVQTLVR